MDRKEFDGEFIVPPEIRSRANSIVNSRSLRIHGGLLTISRSRTFLSLSTNNRTSIHNSTPDLSRSVPNTPNSNHKLTLTSSYDSVLEESEIEGENANGIPVGKFNNSNKKSHHYPVTAIFNDIQIRRKSEDLLNENRKQQSSSNPSKLLQKTIENRQMIPRVKNISPRPILLDHDEAFSEKQSIGSSSSSSISINSQNSVKNSFHGEDQHDSSRWGNFRGSNSFQSDLNFNTLSTYTIPRVTLNHQKISINETSTTSVRSMTANRKSLPENSRVSTFLPPKKNNESSA